MKRLPKVVIKRLGRERAVGEAIFGENIIHVDPRQTPVDFMDTMIHEAAHLAWPDMPEAEIADGATFIARVLWSQGFRKCDL